jgi:uncharacterized protein (TIGR02117 family)
MRVGRALTRALLALLLVVPAAVALYLLAALVLGLLPANTDFRSDPDGIPVYIRTNGVHAEIVLPTRAGGVDWSESFPASDMRALAAPTQWIAFGWGDRGFFITTPTWADLRAKTAFIALTGRGEGAMHVEYIERPRAYPGREVRLSPDQYARLVGYVRASFVLDAAGRPRRIDAPGYFDRDAFYDAVPRYVFWFTSNDWVRRGLMAAGVRSPRWSPFDTAIFFQLERL